jgi:predicted amidophosphoribosyltransferase
VCRCGAVVNRNGTFTCACGSPLDVDDPVCRRCGTEYEVRRGGR